MESVKPHNNNLPVLKLVTSKGALYKGDSLPLLEKIKSNSIDCVFADPPFNLGKNYAPGIEDLLPEDKYLEWTRRWLSECVRVLKPGGSLFIYHMPKWLFAIGSYLNDIDSIQFRHWIAMDSLSVADCILHIMGWFITLNLEGNTSFMLSELLHPSADIANS